MRRLERAKPGVWWTVVAAAVAAIPLDVWAQDAPPSFTPGQIDQMVSPIALYPDPVLSQVLTAATFPDQVIEANKWAVEHKDMNGEELGEAMDAAGLEWDASVQALIPFPEVLEKMVSEETWMRQLGDAVLAQRGDVMASIQRMRKKAQDAGNLKSTDQMVVETTSAPAPSSQATAPTSAPTSSPETSTSTSTSSTTNTTIIEIQPADPQVIYVPTYPPEVYAPPPPGPSAGGMMFGFMAGVAVASVFDDNYYGGCGFGWSNNTVIINNNSFSRTWNNRNSYRPPYNPPRSRSRAGNQANVGDRGGNPGNRGGSAQRPGDRGTQGNLGGQTRDQPGSGNLGGQTRANQPSSKDRARTQPGAGSRGYSKPAGSASTGAVGGYGGGRSEANAGARGRSSSGGARGGAHAGGRRR
jgi:hypothetical protein